MSVRINIEQTQYKELVSLAKQIKLVIFDVDGVLTNGGLYFDNHGEEYKVFNSKDGHGIRMLMDSGIEVAIITGRTSKLLAHRAENLKIPKENLYQGYRDKRPAFDDLLKTTGLNASEIAFVGDDVIDLPIMTQVGLPVAVADAHWFVKEQAKYTCQLDGGQGAVREFIEIVLDAQSKLDDMLESYLK